MVSNLRDRFPLFDTVFFNPRRFFKQFAPVFGACGKNGINFGLWLTIAYAPLPHTRIQKQIRNVF